MGEQRSIIGHLTLTAWESWSAEPHWRNAVIISIVGAIAFGMAKAPPSPHSTPAVASQPNTSNTPPTNMQSAVQSGNATMVTPTSKSPLKLKPTINQKDVIIKHDEKGKDDFGRSHGDN